TRRPSEIESLLEVNGKRIWARMNLRAIKIRGRRFVLVVCENLSAEKLKLVLERRLRDHIEKAKQEWEQTFDSIPDLILILDGNRRILRANKPMADMLGMNVQDLVGKHCYQYLHGTSGPPDRCPLREVRDSEKTYFGEIRFENLEGDYEVALSPIIAKSGGLEGIVHVCRDVTVRKQAERERQRLLADLIRIREDLAYRVSHDSLTGLLNRPAILGVLEKGLDRSSRENTPLGVILADVDHFKRINDEHGHLAGDAVLQAVGRRVKTSMRSYDSVGRYGGEEFIVVVPGCDMARLQDVAARLREKFDGKPIRTAEGEFDITLSIGVFLVQGSHATNVNSVIRNVDTALYRAKDLGRNRVEFMT
ncbi:MAG: diguanylate cyclase, partial [Pseudomonadota bacterium]